MTEKNTFILQHLFYNKILIQRRLILGKLAISNRFHLMSIFTTETVSNLAYVSLTLNATLVLHNSQLL